MNWSRFSSEKKRSFSTLTHPAFTTSSTMFSLRSINPLSSYLSCESPRSPTMARGAGSMLVLSMAFADK